MSSPSRRRTNTSFFEVQPHPCSKAKALTADSLKDAFSRVARAREALAQQEKERAKQMENIIKSTTGLKLGEALDQMRIHGRVQTAQRASKSQQLPADPRVHRYIPSIGIY